MSLFDILKVKKLGMRADSLFAASVGMKLKAYAEFNIWDEQWELGTYNVNTGEKGDNNNLIRSKNLIPIDPTKNYYLNFWYNLGSNSVKLCFFDSNGDFISGKAKWSANLASSEIPTNAAYMLWASGAYRSTYENDVCINISKTTGSPKNGDYVPYKG